MAETDVDICNEALMECGQKETISSLDDNTTPARLCNKLYDSTLRKTLAAAPWKFATKRWTLVLLQSTRDGWANVYEWPDDLVHAMRISNGARPGQPIAGFPLSSSNSPDYPPYYYAGPVTATGVPPPIPFDVELGDDGESKVICTDQAQAIMVGIAYVTAVPIMPDLFVDAMVLNLASRLARSLPVKEALAQSIRKEYRAKILEALAEAQRGSREDPLPDATYISVRG